MEDVGLSAIYRSYSKPYFKFQDMLDVYRNNGNIYDDTGRVVQRGQVMMNFDGGTYFGFFESFNYTEDAEKPNKFSFDFIYKAERSFTGI